MKLNWTHMFMNFGEVPIPNGTTPKDGFSFQHLAFEIND
jgi:hypothetical protein